MTIFDKLHAILTASPSPVPLIGSRIYQTTAGQRVDYPYVTMSGFETPILTHEGYAGTRRWRVSLSFFDQDGGRLETAVKQVDGALIGYNDNGAPGVQYIMPHGRTPAWVDADRVFQVVRDLDIMEDLS